MRVKNIQPSSTYLAYYTDALDLWHVCSRRLLSLAPCIFSYTENREADMHGVGHGKIGASCDSWWR